MATLSQVEDAIAKGNKRLAGELLQQVIREKPSAEAWYVAATLTADKATKIKHLQRALQFNSKHLKSLDLLDELRGVPVEKRATTLAPKVPLNKRTQVARTAKPTRKQSRIGRIVGYLILIAVTGGITFAIINQPPPPPVPIVNAGISDYQQAFQASGITVVSSIEQPSPSGFNANSVLLVVVQDTNGTRYNVEVFTYLQDAGSKRLIGDTSTLRQRANTSNALVLLSYQAAMLYPKELSQDNKNILIASFSQVNQKIGVSDFQPAQ